MEEQIQVLLNEEISKDEDKIIEGNGEYPLVALRGKSLFPKILLNFEVGRIASINAVNMAVSKDSKIVIAPQKNAFIENPKNPPVSVKTQKSQDKDKDKDKDNKCSNRSLFFFFYSWGNI